MKQLPVMADGVVLDETVFFVFLDHEEHGPIEAEVAHPLRFDEEGNVLVFVDDDERARLGWSGEFSEGFFSPAQMRSQ